MKQPLFFHIGTPKSGTTSIQRAMRLLRTTFESEYLYPGALKTESHMIETCLMLKESGQPLPDLSWAPEIKSYLENASLPKLESLLSSWSEECHIYKSKINLPILPPIILSCEFAYEVLAKPETLLYLKKLLRNFSAKFIIYLRQIDEHCNADFIQSLKYGNWYGMESYYHMKTDRRGYLTDMHSRLPEILSIYVDIFGQDSVILRSFERSRLYKNNVVADFFRLLGLELPREYSGTFQNRSVPYDFMIYFVNNFGNPINRSTRNKVLFDKLMNNETLLNMQTISSKFAYSPEERQEMLQSVHQSYKLLDQMFGIKLGESLYRFKPSNQAGWDNAANLDPVRCNIFQKIIDSLDYD